jgi:NAD+ synthase
MGLTKAILMLDPAAATARIEETLREQVLRQLKRKGVIVALSGGIDSSVTLSLCVRALGEKRVVALQMPEYESADENIRLAQQVIDQLKVASIVENIGPILEAAGCYRRRDEAIRKQVPEYDAEYKCKVVMANVQDHKGFEFFHLIVQSPNGMQKKLRMEAETYLGIVAATNMKQRARKFFEYYHADRLNYAVTGTPNRLEYDQGFFVKNGDGAADVKPIAHLYKTQVYQLAEYLGIPEEIRLRPPTTDTYSLPQSQEEFYFSVPYEQMDLCLYGLNFELPAAEVGRATGLRTDQVSRIYAQIASKRRATRYLHTRPLSIEKIEGPYVD